MGRKQYDKPDYYTQREWNRIRARERAQARATRNLVLIAIVMLAVAAALIYSVWFFIFRSHDTGLRMSYDMKKRLRELIDAEKSIVFRLQESY